ncbi:dihydrodiol dehydrogenase [Saccharolobus sp. E5-1-F]|uniref:dihydrodiol dehydrogenase n=1 Tax=Saccharolobus sp. E5-1-F TaxID=2663019 RepID=UPI0015E8DFF5|nr:dihydrodiol dehydrogenase [Sulfolobus sp. E5-1-F]
MEEIYEETGEYIELKNEYAYVLIRKVRTKSGERLEIFSPNFNLKKFLDPLELESVLTIDHEEFYKLIDKLYNSKNK